MKAIIIGAGNGGLSTAIALRKIGMVVIQSLGGKCFENQISMVKYIWWSLVGREANL